MHPRFPRDGDGRKQKQKTFHFLTGVTYFVNVSAKINLSAKPL